MKPSDELLAEQLGVIANTCSLQADSVYHLEVYESSGLAGASNAANYPCFVYRKSDFAPELELSGEAEVQDDTYEVTCVAQDSDALRCMAGALQRTYHYRFLAGLQTAYPSVLDWLVENDSEQNEFAVEQQDKGYKTATMIVRIVTDTMTGAETCP